MAKVVIVEDDFDLSRIIRDVLVESGHEVISYMQPSPDVSEHLREYAADLLILDARLNRTISGWDIIEKLKENPETRDLPIIVCSGATDEIEAHRQILHAYGVPVLVKPFDLSELESLVEQSLGHATSA